MTKCHGLKIFAPDGKMRLTDAADTETMLRLIQSIPLPNADPFKLWLARAGYWRKLKQRLKEEGSEVVTKCNHLKMQAPDGKMRFTDAADDEQIVEKRIDNDI